MAELPYFQRHRQEWIAETLRIFGFINRVHLERKFGLSTPQASKDLQQYVKAHPDAVTYDLSLKRFVETKR
jgi:hypothetical protein